MTKTSPTPLLTALLAVISTAPAWGGTPQTPTASDATEKTALDLSSYEVDYIGSSSIRGGHVDFGQQDLVSNEVSYGHRFSLGGQWYFRAGIDYLRYDFGSTAAPIPDHLQSINLPLAVEYVVQGFAGAAIEIHPGFYFQDKIRANNFDIPWDAYSAIPIRDKKLYGMVGLSGAQYYPIPVIPIAGFIWLINDHLRTEAIFPHPSVVYTPVDDWEYRILGEITGGGFRTDPNITKAVGPRLNDAIVEYYDFRQSVQATYSHLKPFDLVLGAGWIFEREFNYYRADKRFTVAGAPFLRLQLKAEF